MTRLIGLIIFVLGALLTANASAQPSPTPTISASYSFNSAVRAGSWTPLIVTVNDPLSRNLDLQIDTATGSPIGASIHIPITTYGRPTNYTVYLPTAGDQKFPDVWIQLRDPQTGRKLGDPQTIVPQTHYWQQDLTFAIVTSSGQANFVQRNYELATEGMQFGTLRPTELPLDRIGYQGIDVLMLYGIDLNKLDLQVQQSIASWVEAGGQLIFWPADHLLNENAPLAKILPVKIGEIDSLDVASINKDYQSSLGVNSILARSLTPIGRVESIKFHERFPPSIQSQFGMGRICVLPVDVFDLRTGDVKSDRSFAIDVLKGMMEFKQAYPSSNRLAPVEIEETGTKFASSRARREILSRLANVTDLKVFNPSLLFWMMLGLTILVGPVDWFVLRALKRQPWTWFTTLGWAGLAAVSATWLALAGRGGSSTYRSITIIDQLDGRTIAKTQLACLYSSQTRKFEIVQNSPGWWRIPWDGSYLDGRRRNGSFVDFHQSAQSNSLLPFTVRKWNVLVLESEAFGDDGLKLETNLSIENDRVAGTFRNSTPWPITSLALVTSSGATRIDRAIAAGESIDISEALSFSTQSFLLEWPEVYLNQRTDHKAVTVVGKDPNTLLFLARFENYDGPQLTDNTHIDQQHTAVVRGLIHLDGEEHE